MRYLLDTNIFIAVMARGDRQVMRRMAQNRSEIVLSAIVLHELYFGAFNSGIMDRSLARIKDLKLPTIAFDDGDARAAGEIRAGLKRQGKPIGQYDVLIAGQARARNLTVVTANVGEFARVEGLSIENWVEP